MDSYQMYCESSRIIMALANLSLTIGLVCQCWRLYRTKSTKSITLSLVASVSLQRIILLNYGIAIQEWPTIAGGAMSLPIIGLIAIGYWRFRGHATGAAAPLPAAETNLAAKPAAGGPASVTRSESRRAGTKGVANARRLYCLLIGGDKTPLPSHADIVMSHPFAAPIASMRWARHARSFFQEP